MVWEREKNRRVMVVIFDRGNVVHNIHRWNEACYITLHEWETK